MYSANKTQIREEERGVWGNRLSGIPRQAVLFNVLRVKAVRSEASMAFTHHGKKERLKNEYVSNNAYVKEPLSQDESLNGLTRYRH
jgi:hypothetical protein